MERVPGTNIWHTHNIPSVGIKTNIYITPDSVSFVKVEVSEDNAVGVVTGYFVGTPSDGMQHAGHGAGTWAQLLRHVAGKGTQVNGEDNIKTGHCNYGTPYRNGTFDWPIPWVFRVGSGTAKRFTIVHHKETINSAGDMTVSKGGASGSARLTDPSSNF